ncbi:MAG TPA: calcium-binding protein [Allosphingosinicella sp.]|nr:calcium-binding protein [Allosphingosinicella sp.]
MEELVPLTNGTPPVLVNTTTANSQGQSTVADIPGFGYVVIWQGPGANPQFPSESGLFGQCYAYDGSKIGQEFILATNPTGFKVDADVIGGAGGLFTVTWTSIDQAFTGVYMKTFSLGGGSAGQELQVNMTTAGSEETSQITRLSNGNLLVTWQATSNTPGETGVFARLFNATGTAAVGDQFMVNSGPAGAIATPSIAADKINGGFVATWCANPGDGDFDIFMQRFDANGAKIGPEVMVNATDEGLQRRPVVVTLADGSFVVAWDHLDPGGQRSDVYAQRYTFDGQKIGAEFVVTAGIAMANATVPAIAATADGGFAITFQSSFMIMVRNYDAFGNALGDAWPIAEDVPILQTRPDIALLGDGSFIVSYGNGDIFTQRFRSTDYLTDGNDRAMGTDGSDYLEGFGGDDILRGSGGDDLFEGGLGADRMIGGAGRDEVTYANALSGISLNLLTGGHSGEAQGDTFEEIEQISLSRFNDRFIGGDLDDVVYGLAGDDILSGGAGINRLDGGDGNDVLEGGIGTDILLGGEGFDEVTYARSTFGLAIDLPSGRNFGAASADSYFSIEKYTLSRFNDSFTGDAGDDRASGGGGDDAVNGGAGNDWLEGNDGNDTIRGGAGIDRMDGGFGDDLYYVDEAADLVLDYAFGGNDRVIASVSYALATGISVETLEAAPAAPGGAAINLTGNEFANRLVGNDGANMLDGRGGSDVMAGGLGDDRYMVDSSLDTVVETAGQGNDRVFAGASYVLGAGVSVETLSTTDNAGTAAIDLTGNELANTMLGNAGANALTGGGGNDVLDGKEGNDILSGGANDDILYGRAGNDLLAGGSGKNYLEGGAGDDRYVVDNAADTVVELAGEGADRIFASVSYTLAAGVSVETLSTGDNAGTAAIDLIGNELANTLFGNAGANALSGGGGADLLDGKDGADRLDGGAGSDTLWGGTGADLFAFTAALGANNVDAIGDFTAGLDRIALDDAVFAGIGGLGQLNAAAFHTGAAAADGSDRILYNAATGALSFDADGSGAGAAVQFATLAGGLNLAASDFLVI